VGPLSKVPLRQCNGEVTSVPPRLLIFAPRSAAVKRTFITNLALLLVLNLLVKPFYILGIDAGVQNAVGSAEYGTYAALLSLSFLLNIILDLGITNYNTRNIAQHAHLMGKYLSGIAGIRIILALIYAAITLFAAFALGYKGPQLMLLGWLVLNQVLVASILYLRSNIAGAQRFRQDSLLSVLDRALLIGVIGWLLWGRDGSFRIEWFVYAQTGAYAFTLLVALGMVLRLSGKVVLGWRPAFNVVMLRQSFPYALLILLMTFYYRTDTLMLERMLPEGSLQAGIYMQGFRFFEAFNMLGYLFAGLLLPMFSRMLKEAENVAPLAYMAFRLVLAGSLAVAIFGSLEAQAIMDLRYSEHTDLSAPAFAILIWCFVSVATTYIFGTLLTAGGNLRLLNWMAGGGAVLNIGLNLILIPRMQVEGAAWASLVTQGLTAAIQIFLAVQVFRLPSLLPVLWRVLPYAAGLFGAYYLLLHLGKDLISMMIFYFIFSLLWAFTTGLLSPKPLLHAFDRRIEDH
jgi:O-antigen/teichoic acid export membrane protein